MIKLASVVLLPDPVGPVTKTKPRGLWTILTTDSGARVVVTLAAGDIVGESALLTSTPRDAAVRAAEPSALLALRRAVLIETLDKDKRVADHLVDLMRRRDRPRAKAGVVLEPLPTASGETIWVLADPQRLGAYHRLSSLGLFVWHRLDGDPTVPIDLLLQ